ncbi:hypothetical protein [Anaeromicrobium sediminis]|uniref:Uncharacterized protein n=1 Tax=Anaeromicrobium sediminis TaxID=1478221 RepID=A0A267MEB2_9FIRM|nr:hypothetical protein [Anaeromicrobium sediminis]PAB57886.1 hypothetical protein CCE28_17980 [Anaeromicrobium sediminis]
MGKKLPIIKDKIIGKIYGKKCYLTFLHINHIILFTQKIRWRSILVRSSIFEGGSKNPPQGI